MTKETEKYDEDYLNGLIAKAKKSWEGVDVDSFMSDLRDDSTVKFRLDHTWDEYKDINTELLL